MITKALSEHLRTSVRDEKVVMSALLQHTCDHLGNVARFPPPRGVDRLYVKFSNNSLSTHVLPSNMLAFDHHDSLSGENGGQRLPQRYTAGESKKNISLS